MVRASKLGSVLLAGILLMGCGGSSSSQEVIVIRPVGDTMAYEATEFTVQAGASVKIIMENTATVDAMKHNVVVLALGTDPATINQIGLDAIAAGEAGDYIPDNPNILFYTPLAGPGETTEVEFTAPEAGEYTFICTFPGHFALMQGVLRVE